MRRFGQTWGMIEMQFAAARRDDSLVVLEGFHALKHAIRFGADVLTMVTADPSRARHLAAELAPDIAAALDGGLQALPTEVFTSLAVPPPPTGVLAIARRPPVDPTAVLGDRSPQPVVLLDRPRHQGNVGAVIRVAAGVGAAGVLTTGTIDPWHPAVLRGSAGLHFAVAVARVDTIPATDRRLVALDPGGDPLRPGSIPPRALLALGSERSGLDADLRARADLRLGIPMQPGVSSLNLAT